MSKDPSARPWQWRCDWCLRRWWRGWCLTMKALLLLVIQILDASIRAKQGGASGALDATWDGPWTLARFVNILSSYFISAWYLLFSLPRSNVMNTTLPAWINTHPQNMLLHHSLFRVLQNQYLNIYDLNELWTNNCNCTGVLGCIKHSRWWIITRLQPPKCITLLCFNKNVSFKLESIGHQYLFIGLLRFILIFKAILSDAVDMFMSRCDPQSCQLAVILHTNVPVSRLNTDIILISAQYKFCPNRESAKYFRLHVISNFRVKKYLWTFSHFSPQKYVHGGAAPGTN